MTVDLMEMARAWALATLPYDRSDKTISAEVHGMNIGALLRAYHNWRTRLVEARPRRLHLSSAFSANPDAASLKGDLDALLDKIATGQDLTPHLSKRIKMVVDSSAKKAATRDDLDLLLNEWEVHHLHISRQYEPSGEFVERGDPLLFVVFREADAYVIDLMTHGDFNRDHIFRILALEWPEAKLAHQLQGISVPEVSTGFNEAERQRLRKRAFNSTFAIAGNVYAPAGGLTGAGTSTKASLFANWTTQRILEVQDLMNNRPHELVALAHQEGRIWPKVPHLVFEELRPKRLAFIETDAKLVIPVS